MILLLRAFASALAGGTIHKSLNGKSHKTQVKELFEKLRDLNLKFSYADAEKMLAKMDKIVNEKSKSKKFNNIEYAEETSSSNETQGTPKPDETPIADAPIEAQSSKMTPEQLEQKKAEIEQILKNTSFSQYGVEKFLSNIDEDNAQAFIDLTNEIDNFEEIVYMVLDKEDLNIKLDVYKTIKLYHINDINDNSADIISILNQVTDYNKDKLKQMLPDTDIKTVRLRLKLDSPLVKARNYAKENGMEECEIRLVDLNKEDMPDAIYKDIAAFDMDGNFIKKIHKTVHKGRISEQIETPGKYGTT